MGKASSSKKVARAARAGESRRANERRALGFPAVIAIICVLGVALVAFARSTRDAEAAPGLTDHWHAAYGVYDCTIEGFEASFGSEFDPDGIHSHQDGIIHIHPFTASVTGKEAQLGVFLDAMAADIDESAITLPGGQQLEAGVDCGGEPAVIQVLRWSDARAAVIGGENEVITSDLRDIRFLNDGEAFVLARAPLGAEIPPPESVPQLDNLTDVVQSQGPETEADPLGGLVDQIPVDPELLETDETDDGN